MTGRQSVLEPTATIVREDAVLVPRLNWRSWRTRAVFLGVGLALAVTATLVALLCMAVAAMVLDEPMLQGSVGFVAALLLLSAGDFALKRAFPVRDTAGKPVPGKHDLSLGFRPFELLYIPWLMGFLMIAITGVLLVQDIVGAAAGWTTLCVIIAVILQAGSAFDLPFRILWRAPVKEEEPGRDG